MKFYLGTHQPHWLWQTDVPLFVSARRLRDRKTFQRATCDWALDSGAFTELQKYGRWTVEPEQYVDEVVRYGKEIGRLEWAACQDWMCEPIVINGGKVKDQVFVGTKLNVEIHQQKTIESYLLLTRLRPFVRWVPVLQGWFIQDYVNHYLAYLRQGIDLTRLPLVGLGSVCRRQATDQVERLIVLLTSIGIRLHGFGFKTLGLARVKRYLRSSDSLAWSYAARNSAPMEGCLHKNCANCIRYALWWRERLMTEHPQSCLFD